MEKNILIKKKLSKETKALLKSMLRGNPKKRCDIHQLMKNKVFEKFSTHIQRDLNSDELDILKENYLLNVRSETRVPPAILQFRKE